MTHPLSPLVRAVIEKAANAAESAIVNVCRKDPMPTAGRVMEAVDAAIRALDADQPAAELAHLVPGVAEVERLRAAIISETGPDLGAESREPSLQSIIYHHYARWFPENEAIALTDRYLSAIQETSHDR